MVDDRRGCKPDTIAVSVCNSCFWDLFKEPDNASPQVPAPVPRLLWGCAALPDHVKLGVQADAHFIVAGLLEGCSVAQSA